MSHVTANGIQICYETYGDPSAPTVLMIMGLGGQLTMWSDELIENLVAGGYRVIIFDNRDIGLSHHHTGEKSPAILRQILLRRIGIKLKTPYQLSDMAKDTIGLMDALKLDRVHLVGISMGGMIAQHVSTGDRLMFVHRDHESVYSDLSASLLALRERVKKQTGTFEPKGALYVSCVARAFSEFEGEHKNELALIHDIIGDVPLTGFYAGGEINKARLYGYTGILTLFL